MVKLCPCRTIYSKEKLYLSDTNIVLHQGYRNTQHRIIWKPTIWDIKKIFILKDFYTCNSQILRNDLELQHLRRQPFIYKQQNLPANKKIH